ncbi:PadR family transcriptional regulator [Cohnella nanjingensis]|uniref:PadR family transcriptional regulator n=1 Tax=Cohnella nanjingensis TaxID=1387779 RepID=A0A7X0VFA2_9BACL|nr:PadR family transcriptional regulator [Cohnella nanjingensis]MBB6671827.1 PadR family transcriptional regulator [Cohnella nanjingensis]
MYEFIVLGFFMRYPMHGYRISKIVNDIVGPYAKFSSGRLYPLLGKLEKQGYLTLSHANSDDRQRMYEITDAGRKQFIQLVMDCSANLGEYQKIFWLKAIFFDLLTSDQREYLLNHYVSYCQAHISYIQKELEDLRQRFENNEGQLNSVISVMNRNIQVWKSDLEIVQTMLKERGE